MATIIPDSIDCLRQGLDLARRIDTDAFTFRCPECFGSTIGGHLRHNTDHYRALFGGIETGEVDYDARPRDATQERCPETTASVHESLIAQLEQVPEAVLEVPLTVKLDSGGETGGGWAQSSLHRELQFLLSHTVHHYALVAVICRLSGVAVADGFGVAPSTLRYQCASSR